MARSVSPPRSTPTGFVLVVGIAAVIAVVLGAVGVAPVTVGGSSGNGTAGARSGSVGPATGACWRPPVDAPVVEHFREPACPWCPGKRGIEFGTPAGTVVRAVAAGTVTFSGDVVGVGYVVVRHADGRRVTYGGVVGARPPQGDRVVAGARVGTTAGQLYFGLRDGDRYLDPAPYLGHDVYRARLLPVDGWSARPAPPPVLRCADPPAPAVSPPGPTGVGTRYTRAPTLSIGMGPTSDPSRDHPPLSRSPPGAWGWVPQPH